MKEYKGYQYKKEGDTWTVLTKEGKSWVVEIPSEEAAKVQIDNIVASETTSQNEKSEIEQLKQKDAELEAQITELQLAMVENDMEV